jgi:hypothetical protein
MCFIYTYSINQTNKTIKRSGRNEKIDDGIAIFTFTGSIFAQVNIEQDKIDRMSAVNMESFTPDTVNWQDEPILPKGAKSVIVVGDPSKNGVFIAWLKFPAN